MNKGIRIPQLAKIATLFPDWWRILNLGKGLLFDFIEREGDLKDEHRNTQNAALNVDQLYELAFRFYWFDFKFCTKLNAETLINQSLIAGRSYKKDW